jgi:hypothetical protein
VAQIRAKIEALTQASHALAQAVYERVQQQTTTSAGAANGGSDDEVVEDAEYEVIDEDARKA